MVVLIASMSPTPTQALPPDIDCKGPDCIIALLEIDAPTTTNQNQTVTYSVTVLPGGPLPVLGWLDCTPSQGAPCEQQIFFLDTIISTWSTQIVVTPTEAGVLTTQFTLTTYVWDFDTEDRIISTTVTPIWRYFFPEMYK